VKVLTAIAALASIGVIAGCGGSSSGGSKPPSSALKGHVLHLTAPSDGALKFDKATLSVKPGTITIVLTSDAPEVHNVTIADDSGILGATPTFEGGTKTVTVKLKAGTYRFYCSVAGHEAAGMKGTLTVG